MPRVTRHPAEVELLALELGRNEDGSAEAALHVAGCRVCARRKTALGRLAAGIEEASSLENELSLPGEGTSALPEDPARRDRLRELSVASDDAGEVAQRILAAARASDDALTSCLAGAGDSEAGRLGLLYAAQDGGRLVAADPHRALALARALSSRAAELPTAGLVPSRRLAGEASLLASQALLDIGHLAEARAAAGEARASFAASGDEPFDRALCAYYEGTAAAFQGEYPFAERALKNAVRLFVAYDQDSWTARAEAALGTLCTQRGNPARAIPLLESALERLDERDQHVLTAVEINLGRALALDGEYERARSHYARALALARRHDLRYLAFGVRSCLAELDLMRGEAARALATFDTLIAEADRLNLEEDRVVTRLYAAECLGRLSRTDELLRRLKELRPFVTVQTLAGTPAWQELASCLDRGDVEEGLVDHVRACLGVLSGGLGLPARLERRRA